MAMMHRRTIFPLALLAVLLQLYALITVSEANVSDEVSWFENDDIESLGGHDAIRSVDDTVSLSVRGAKLPKFCSRRFRLDAFAQGGDGFMYAFRKKNVFKVGPNGLEDGYPKKTKKDFPGVPKGRVSAAAFAPHNKKLYLFAKEMKVLRFSKENETSDQFQLDEGYPKQMKDIPGHIHLAALALDEKDGSKLFLFGKWKTRILLYLWKTDDDTIEMLNAPIPANIEAFLRKAPKRPDAAFRNTRGDVVFFKKNKYKHINPKGGRSKRRPFAAALFGAACRGTASFYKLGDYQQQQ